MKLRLISFLFLVAHNLVAQQTTLELTYDYTNAGLGEKRVVTLLVSNLESLSMMTKADTLVANGKDFNLDGEDVFGRQVYRSAMTGELIFRDFVSRNGTFEACLVKDPLKYTWNFESVAKTIGPYECRSARTQFRGRIYTAWYAESLAVPCGPWKFAGLPGAMVEIRSDDGSISFRLLKVTTVQRPIPRIAEAREISMKDFVVLREGSTTDFINRLSAQLPRGAQIAMTATEDHNLETSFDDVKR